MVIKLWDWGNPILTQG